RFSRDWSSDVCSSDLGSLHGRLEGLEVLSQLVWGEARLADGRVDDAGLVAAELDLTGLERPHYAADVRADGAGLRVGQQAAGARSEERRVGKGGGCRR